jgi:hypothetical protein
MAATDLRTDACAQSLPGAVKLARTVCDRVQQCHRDDFRAVCSAEMVRNLSRFVDAFFGYTLVLLAHFRGRAADSARAAATVAPLFAALAPPAPAHARFLEALADVQFARAQAGAREVGAAIAHGRSALARADAPAARGDAALRALVEPFRRELADFEHKNSRIYMQQIPKCAELRGALGVLPPADIWALTVEAPTIAEILRSGARQGARDRAGPLLEEADRAAGDAAARLEQLPAAHAAALAAQVADLHAKRALAAQLADDVARIVGANPQALARAPAIAERLPALRAALGQAANADLRYETEYAKAKSEIEALEQLGAQLGQAQAELPLAHQELAAALDAIAAATEGVQPATVMAGENERKAAFDAACARLEGQLAAVRRVLPAFDQEVERRLQHYLAQAATIQGGFAKGIECYQKLTRAYEDIKNRVTGTPQG